MPGASLGDRPEYCSPAMIEMTSDGEQGDESPWPAGRSRPQLRRPGAGRCAPRRRSSGRPPPRIACGTKKTARARGRLGGVEAGVERGQLSACEQDVEVRQRRRGADQGVRGVTLRPGTGRALLERQASRSTSTKCPCRSVPSARPMPAQPALSWIGKKCGDVDRDLRGVPRQQEAVGLRCFSYALVRRLIRCASPGPTLTFMCQTPTGIVRFRDALFRQHDPLDHPVGR